MSLPGFVGAALDRVDQVRGDPQRLAATFADPRARVLLLNGLDPVASGENLAVKPISADARLEEYALLGIGGDGPLFARLDPKVPHGGTHAPSVWQIAGQLSAEALATYGGARSLVDWHARHGFCSVCGFATRPVKAGWSRKCDKCGAEHFPRVDPVVIMLAEHGGRVLVGRQPRFPAGRYSALAGFVEPGETLEEAVARELWEEAGIRVSQVRYVMSQPWPFPSSLMIGCIAVAQDDALTLDETEIEHAFWIDKAGVRAVFAGTEDAPFVAPPTLAVAHHLLRHWLEQQP